LVASITAEQLGSVEPDSNGIGMPANGPGIPDSDAPNGGETCGALFEDMKDMRLVAAFLSGGGGLSAKECSRDAVSV
jgi:Mn-containing catalase